jgi:hypothetical protein
MNVRFNQKLNLNETDEIGIGLHPVFRILGLLAGMGSSPIIRSFIHLFFVFFVFVCFVCRIKKKEVRKKKLTNKKKPKYRHNLLIWSLFE